LRLVEKGDCPRYNRARDAPQLTTQSPQNPQVHSFCCFPLRLKIHQAATFLEGDIAVLTTRDISVLLLQVAVLVLMLKNRDQIRRLPASAALIAAFCMLITASMLSIIEDFYWRDFFNLIQHICRAASAVTVAAWCLKAFGKAKGENGPQHHHPH
jgi:hypothetical protein